MDRNLKATLLKYEPLGMLVFMWAIYLVDLLIPIKFTHLGIQPREFTGLLGIFTSPFLHSGLFHIISNSIPFLILGSLVRLQGAATFWSVTVFVAVFGGLGTWLFSQAGYVVGASGLVFGYWSFLLFNGIYNRSPKSIAIAIVVFVLYGTMVFSFFSFHPRISWSAHLFGAASGFLIAKLLAPRNKA